MTVFPFAGFGRSMVVNAGVGQADLLIAGDSLGEVRGYGTNGVRSPVGAYKAPSAAISDLAFSNDGKLLAVIAGNGQLLTYLAGEDMLLKAATLQNSNCRKPAWSNDLFAAVSFGSYVRLWRRNDLGLSQIATDVYVGDILNSCSLTTDGTYLAAGGGSSPFIYIYKNNGDDTFTKLANPATKPAGQVLACAFSPDGNYLAVGSSVSPYLTIYSRSGDTFTKITAPTITNSVRKLAWSSDSTYLAVAHLLGNNMTVLQRSGSTFTALTAPVSADRPTSDTIDCAVRPDSAQVAFVDSGNHLYLYDISGTSLVKATTPAVPSRTWTTVAYSPL